MTKTKGTSNGKRLVIVLGPTAVGKTDFSIDIDANLNLMMRSMLGSKVQQGIDALVDGLVAASEGRMPEMPEDFRR